LPLQLHLQLADLLEQLCLLDLAFFIGLALVGTFEQLTGAIQELPLPLAHLDRVDGLSAATSDRLVATDRLYGDSGPELRAAGVALFHCVAPFSCGTPPLRLTMWPVQKNQSNSYSSFSDLFGLYY